MSASDSVRWGGWTGMMAGLAFIVWVVAPPAPPDSFYYVLGNVLYIVAWLLLLVGLVGFHTLQKENYGIVGRAGFYTIIVAALALIVALVGFMFGSTALLFLNSLGNWVMIVGFVLYGVATLQARVLPRWCGVVFIASLPVWMALSIVAGYWGTLLRLGLPEWVITENIMEMLGGVLFGLLWLALGYALLSRSDTVDEQPARAS